MYKSQASVLKSEKKNAKCSNVFRRNEETGGNETVVVHLRLFLIATQRKARFFFQAPKRLARISPMIRTFTCHAVPCHSNTRFCNLFPFLSQKNPFITSHQIIISPPSAPLASLRSNP